MLSKNYGREVDSTGTARINTGLLVGTVLCAAIFVCTLFMSLQQSARLSNGVYTEAEVTRKTHTEFNRGQRSVYGIAVYADENGEQYTYEGYLGSSADVGDKITLIRDRDDPSSVIFRNETLSWLPWACAAVLLYFSVCLVFFQRKRRNI